MITQDRLKEVLNYDPETGLFTWRVNIQSRARIGAIAGCNSRAYRVIRIDGRSYEAHRLAWLYMTGNFPKVLIDHINMDGMDNRFFNLREADKSSNALNKPAQRNNKLGIKGVCWVKSNKKYLASTRVRGVTYREHFDTIEEATAAYKKMQEKYHGAFAC